MPALDVTVAVVPRERFSLTERALINLYEQTPVPFNLCTSARVRRMRSRDTWSARRIRKGFG